MRGTKPRRPLPTVRAASRRRTFVFSSDERCIHTIPYYAEPQRAEDDAIEALTAAGMSIGYDIRPAEMWELDCQKCGVRFTFARTGRYGFAIVQMEVA
jgi:hypothetical protein